MTSLPGATGKCFIIVIDNYQYRDEREKGRFQQPDVKDFRRLNKAVLGQKATNAAVSEILDSKATLYMSITVMLIIVCS